MSLTDVLRTWDERLDKPCFQLPGLRTYISLYEYAQYLGKALYADFERDGAPGVRPFLSRLEDWVLGAPDDDNRRKLFEMLFYIRFVARQEMHCLYQSAYRGNIIRWLMNRANIPMTPDWEEELDGPLRTLWIGSASDSFHLDSFFHVTEAKSLTARRPAWLDIAEFGTPDRVAAHMDRHGLERIAVLEDFVGTGTQIRPALEFLLDLPNSPEILVCPMFSTALAFDRLKDLLTSPKITYDPVALLSGSNLMPEILNYPEPPEFAAFRRCIEELHSLVGHPVSTALSPYGFGRMGALLVQFGNTPDNCPPVIWNDSDRWRSLFPRKRREGGG